MFLVDINVCLEQLGAEDGDTMSDAYSLEEFEVTNPELICVRGERVVKRRIKGRFRCSSSPS